MMTRGRSLGSVAPTVPGRAPHAPAGPARRCLSAASLLAVFAAPSVASAWPVVRAASVAPPNAAPPVTPVAPPVTPVAPPSAAAAPPPTATSTPAPPSTVTPTVTPSAAPAPAPATPPAPSPASPTAAVPPTTTPPADAPPPAVVAETDKTPGEPTKKTEETEKDAPVPLSLAFHGAMEVYYAWNFNNPSNDITNWRWYDHRHNLFGLQGLWFAPEFQVGPVTGHFQLQLGVLAELFWYSERSIEEDVLWRLLQEATTEWRTPWKRLSIEGGIFNVPFGPEWNLAYKNWNWSTSNLFAMMPYQITGFRLNFDVGRGVVMRVGMYNGWDRIVKDNNRQKALMYSLEWTDPKDEENYVVFNYMLGNERDRDDDRGRAPRHTFDIYGQWHMAKPFTMRLWTFSGFEKRGPLTDGWLGLAVFAKVDPLWWLSIVGRGDYVYTRSATENLFHTDVLPDPAASTALGSGTLTLDFHPHSNVSFRVEGRYDYATFPLFFKGQVPLYDPMNDPRSFMTNANTQATILGGMTTWF